MHDITEITESLQKWNLFIDGVNYTLKHEIKNQESINLSAMMLPLAASMKTPIACSLIQPVTSSLINAITGRRVRKTGQGHEGGFLPLLALPLMMKVLGNGVKREGKRI